MEAPSTYRRNPLPVPFPDATFVNNALRPRVFSFLAGDTPLKGELPKGSGLDTFLTCQKEIVLTLSLGPPANNNRSRARQQQSIRGGAVAWPSPGRVGEARLGLGQFRNDHVQKVELQAPLLLSCVGQEKNRSRMLLVKVRTERVSEGNIKCTTCLNPVDDR